MGINLEKCVLGLELGSTRIKAVLIDENHHPVASGSHAWENRLENGIWTYHMDDITGGIRSCYADLARDVQEKYGMKITRLAAMGISGMMHGYLVFDKDGKLLVPFRTWRNTITSRAAAELSELFRFNIPQRWSIAHLYQAILNDEPHVPDIALITTLSGYIHLLLTGKNVIGAGEASGMFPYDKDAAAFDDNKLTAFDKLIEDRDLPWKIRDILPDVLTAGELGGTLTPEGAALLDDSGNLESGIPLCPPESDAGTGMVATNAVRPRTGNVSAGTSAFSMQVLEHDLRGYYPEIDIVATPSGAPVAMAHANTCTSDIDAWAGIIAEGIELAGNKADMNTLFPALYKLALTGEPDCGGVVSFNCYSGEPVLGVDVGRPMVIRTPDSHFTLANFMRSALYSAIATIKVGMDMLAEEENVETDTLLGHGGYFKTPGVGAQILADALCMPVSTMETAGEGGPWGMAILAAYMCRKENGETLEDYLQNRVFSNEKKMTYTPDAGGVAGFKKFLERYKAALGAERAAGNVN